MSDHPTANGGTTNTRPAWDPPADHDPATCHVCSDPRLVAELARLQKDPPR